MEAVSLLRSQTGVTQQALALKAKTSQPTIALYESGSKSPTLDTLQRLAASLGLDLFVTYLPRMSREDQRSLAYHRAVVRKLRQNPGTVIQQARRTAGRMRRQHPGVRSLLERWEEWLSLPLDDLIACLLDPGISARQMRQVTPFAGLLTPEERARVLRRFRKGDKQ